MINLAPSAVLERIRKMEQQEVIQGYEVRLNPAHFNCKLISFLMVDVEPGQSSETVGDELSSIPEVQEVHFISGDDSYLVKLRTSDTEALNDLMTSCIRKIPGIRSTRTMPVLATHKETTHIPIP